MNDTIADEIMRRLDLLAMLTEQPPALTRRYLTEQHAAANRLVAGWMEAAGMTARTDAAGNIVGRYDAAQRDAPALLIGSHLDTIVDAGRYDGMLGVVLPVSCIQRFNESGRRFPFAIEVIGFGDEEGVRFQSTYLGSRAVAGTFDTALMDRRDANGTTLADAMTAFGLTPSQIGEAARDPAGVIAYVEVHIEQGPVLERDGRPVGVVTAIAGATRLECRIRGMAGHAGTVPMAGRQDALAAAAEAVLAVESVCTRGNGLVGTVGRIAALPGAVNVIPGEAVFSIDIRAPLDTDRQQAVTEVRDSITEICRRRDVAVSVSVTHEAASVPCAERLMAALERAAAASGIDAPRLASGAGHDAAAMSALTDVSMLFVRCKDGISHNPAESISAGDAAVALAVLERFLMDFKDEEHAHHAA